MTNSPFRNERAYEEFLPGLDPVASAVDELAKSGIEERGAIFTRREVVDFILDLIGYTSGRELYKSCLLEPSFGEGDFLIPTAQRLVASFKTKGRKTDFDALRNSIRAVELHANSFEHTREKLIDVLRGAEFSAKQSQALVGSWLIQGDFLLTNFDHPFTHAVGNPPYVRQELIPDVLIAEYRRRYETIFDRADIYIPFYERSLKLLALRGVLGFICADRWMKNRYGEPLRKLIAERFHLRTYVDMVGTQAFHSDVLAYPAITIIANEPPGPTHIARRPKIDKRTLFSLAKALNGKGPAPSISQLDKFPESGAPWIMERSNSLNLVRRLEDNFPLIEEAGCKVGIGVATGADKIFVAPFDALDVEGDRKLPLVMTKDIQSGEVIWRGYGVINPFSDSGKLVSLAHFPKLRAYLERHGSEIKKRHVSQKNPSGWYRTIDRIYPELAGRPKLLIPDIKGDAHVVFDSGNYYPHHNLYYVTSETWNLSALQAVLLSGIARLFVETYSTRMHGGFLRFQAQYLRRIRVPNWGDVPREIKKNLMAASKKKDVAACNRAVAALYGIKRQERSILEG